ncbi:uncharacterized protein [Salminus brasiliensis]|uniref:uncharacterized protein n=1 Tax=Salminus brasiliensis TaxID=930266 RepID=UPI003B832352
MSQICSSDLLVKRSISAVVEPLRDGLCSINRVYEALINAKVDPYSGQCRNYGCFRQQIEQAKQSLERSDQEASTGLKSLDGNIEILTRDEGRLEREMRATQQTLDNLRTEQESNNKLLKQSEGSLEVARRQLRSARDTLQREEKRKCTAGIVTGVGAGLFIIPVVGWVAGSAMVIGGTIGLCKAFDAVKKAEEEERDSEKTVDRYKGKVSDYEWKISQNERNIRQNRDRKEQICTDIQKVKEQRAAVADLQVKVRRAVHLLSVLSGRANVVEGQTRRHIVLEPVMKVMEEVMKAAGEITGNQLLADEGIPRLVNTVREKHNLAVSTMEKQSLEAESDLSELYY